MLLQKPCVFRVFVVCVKINSAAVIYRLIGENFAVHFAYHIHKAVRLHIENAFYAVSFLTRYGVARNDKRVPYSLDISAEKNGAQRYCIFVAAAEMRKNFHTRFTAYFRGDDSAVNTRLAHRGIRDRYNIHTRIFQCLCTLYKAVGIGLERRVKLNSV